MVDIFLSYTRNDLTLMRSVRAKLRSGGVKVWTDENLIPGTQDWLDEIEKTIWGAHALVALMTPEAKRSEWVQREIAYADQTGVTIYPLLGRGELRYVTTLRLINHQWINLTSDFETKMSDLVQSILDTFEFDSLPTTSRQAIIQIAPN